LKKILIISYFFPPSNFAGSHRLKAFAKYLHLFGYWPVVVTRNWDVPIEQWSDMSRSTGEDVIHQKFDHYEVYYLPYKANWRDKLYVKFGEKRFVILRKFMTLIELVFQNFTNRVIPFRNIYEFSSNLLKNDSEIKFAIISGKPFVLFRFGYLLNKKFGLRWTADYRDEWNVSPWNKSSLQYYLLRKLESQSERKWVGSAAYILSVSDKWCESIALFTNKKGYVIMNGFDEDDYEIFFAERFFDNFTITYNGTLYDTQPVELFIEAFRQLADEYKNRTHLHLLFPGLAIDHKRSLQVQTMLKGYERHYEILGRIPKEKVIEMQLRSHVLLMIAHKNITGTHSSKIFEYLACHKPILLCPGDCDVLDAIVKETGAGVICNTVGEAKETLKQYIEQFLKHGSITFSPAVEITQYSRKYQTEKLARIIDGYWEN